MMRFTGLLLLTLVGLGSCQVEQDQIQALTKAYTRATGNSGTFYGAVTKGVLPQLWITDDEATAICALLHKDGVHQTYHPYTCAAIVVCDPSRRNLRVGLAYIMPTAAGTFWNATLNSLVMQSSTSDCPQSPCILNKATSDGQSCSGYLQCNRTAPGGIENKRCPDGQSFNFLSGPCQVDAKCVPPSTSLSFTVRSCVPASGPLPGVSYYNRTVWVGDSDEIIQTLQCPSSQVFDSTNLTACQCVSANPTAQCPITLVNLNSAGPTNNTWSSQLNRFGGDSSVSTISTFPGWGLFTGNTYLSVDSLAGNELTGNFTLEFKFRMLVPVSFSTGTLNLQVGRVFALVGNALAGSSCTSATLDVYLTTTSTSEGIVTAQAKNVLDTVARVDSSVVNLNSEVNVKLSREGGRLTLEVNGQRTSSTVSLGNDRLAATKCGLVLGSSVNPRADFVGVMDNVSLTLNCRPIVPVK